MTTTTTINTIHDIRGLLEGCTQWVWLRGMSSRPDQLQIFDDYHDADTRRITVLEFPHRGHPPAWSRRTLKGYDADTDSWQEYHGSTPREPIEADGEEALMSALWAAAEERTGHRYLPKLYIHKP